MFAFFGLMMTHYVYILKSLKSGLYYKGMTQNVANRLKEHNAGEMNFTSAHIPWILIGIIEKPTKSEALILERKLKNLSKSRLDEFIEKYCA